MSEGAAPQGTPELKIKLIVDVGSQADVAKKLEDTLQGATESAAKSATTAGKAVGESYFGAMVKSQIWMAAFHQASHALKESFLAPLDAIQESNTQVKQLSGTLAALDRSGMSFLDVKEYATGLKDELEEMAMQVGMLDDTLVNVFDTIIERGGHSVEEASKLTEEFALAGRAISGGPESLANGFNMIEMGVVKARNPLVQMISATGVLEGSAKSVAKQMQAMSIDKQMELAEKAVAKMGAKMKDVPMTFEEMKASMSVFSGNILESAGDPMMKGLTKAMGDFRGMFIGDKGPTELGEKILKAATAFGDVMGRVFDVGEEFIESFIGGADEFSGDLKNVWNAILGDSDLTFSQIKEYAASFGKLLGEGTAVFVAGVGGIIMMFQGLIKEMNLLVGDVFEVIAYMPGADRGKHLEHAQGARKDAYANDLKAAQKEVLDAEMKGDTARAAAAKARTLEIQKEIYKDAATGAVGGDFNNAAHQGKELHEAMAKASLSGKLASHDYMGIRDAMNTSKAVNADGNSAMKLESMADNHMKDYIDAYNVAAKQKNDVAMHEIAKSLGTTQDAAMFIGNVGPKMMEGGVENFVKVLREVGNVASADLIESLLPKKEIKIDKSNLVAQFNGPITIKQDFRDQDPDRVAVAFRQDMQKMAKNRLTAFGGPLGF